MQEEKETDLIEEGLDPTDEQLRQMEALEHELEIGSSISHEESTATLATQWKVVEQVLENNHLDFQEGNLKEFSDLYGQEFINLLSKRNLDPEEKKILNLTLKVRLTNLIQTIVFEKSVREITEKNTGYFERLNERLYLENEAAVNNLVDDLQFKLEKKGTEIRALAKQEALDIQAKQKELVEAVRSAEQLRTDIADQQEKTLKAISKALKKDIEGILEPGIERILEREKKNRVLLTSKVFKHLFIVLGFALLTLGATIFQLTK